MLPTKRPNPTLRGYNAAHWALRKQWLSHVDRGEVSCWRCGRWIEPGSKWHLGHDDNDRSKYKGPEHEKCSIKSAAKRGAEKRNKKRKSRQW